VKGLCYPGPTQASDIFIFDITRCDVTHVSSSSYDLSLFCLKAGSHPEENVVAAPGELLSVSAGELWPGIHPLDEAGLDGTIVVPPWKPLGDQTS
jgi:hypothetical protein